VRHEVRGFPAIHDEGANEWGTQRIDDQPQVLRLAALAQDDKDVFFQTFMTTNLIVLGNGF
jgi:hypothetical protein